MDLRKGNASVESQRVSKRKARGLFKHLGLASGGTDHTQWVTFKPNANKM